MADPTTASDDAEVVDPTDVPAPTARTGGVTLGTILFLVVLAWGALLASAPLDDNSFFTHVATGRIILDEGSVPSSDPYTFTAEGEPWTVQSWLASIAYAGAEQAGGAAGLRALVLVAFLGVVAVLWRLTRPATSAIPRLLVVALGMLVLTPILTPRPYVVGFVGLGLVWLALQGSGRPWMLVPLLWLWANAHGSFPLAVGLCVVVILGRLLDREPVQEQLHVLGAVVAGAVLAVAGPLGLDVLVFPVTALTKSGAFDAVGEWQAPNFRSVGERLFLVLLVAALAALVHRPRWRHALPVLAFGAAALLAQRNIVMATVVLVAVLADSIGDIGTLRTSDRPALGRPVVAVLGVVLVLAVALAVAAPVGAVDHGYPARALAWLDERGVTTTDVRVATQDTVGNLLEVLDGPTASVFVDDRVDMLPEDVFADELVLERGGSTWDRVLGDYAIEVVVWERRAPLTALLASAEGWRLAYTDGDWVVACRRGPGCDALSG